MPARFSKLLVGVFGENARLLQWLDFFVSSTRSVHFFVHLFNIINLNFQTDFQNIIETREPRPKQKHRRPEPRKHRTPLWCFSSGFFFGTMRLISIFFGFHQRVSPSLVSIFCNTMESKNHKGSPFTFFGTVTLFKNLIKIFFSEIFKNLLRVPFNFLNILQPTGVSQSTKGTPFYNFEP